MRLRFSHIAAAMLCAVALLAVPPSVARAITQPPEQLPPREQIVAGVAQIGGGMSIGRVSALRPELFPLVWASSRAAGGGVLDLPGTLPVPSWAGPFGAGRVAIWAGHEGFFAASGDGRLDNELFRENPIAWLLGGGNHFGVSSGHQEWLTLANLSPELSQVLKISRVEVGSSPAELTPDVLAHYDALLIGNPWGEFGTSELDALEQWVEAGGGLLVLGLGWSWHQNHSDPWPLLGCLELVWSRYGRDGMQRFMTRAATDCTAGVSTDGDAECTDYFALQLSQAYGVDFTPIIRHWGFTFSDSVAQQTAALPPAQL